ncbi:MAG: divergent polysaccharide deacetylase family protein [bacterium]
MKKKKRGKATHFTFFKFLLFCLIIFLFAFPLYLFHRTNSQANSPSPHPKHTRFRLFHPPKPRSEGKTPPVETNAPPEMNAPPETNLPKEYPPTKREIPARGLPPIGKVAIVIDDVGYDVPLLREFLKVDIPLTISILPNLPHSRESAEIASQAGREIILHMPMQPEKKIPMDSTFITTDLSPSEIEARIEKALRSVPGAVGMSNHMGSLATQNRNVMSAVMATIKKHNLFFLDSLTTPNSVARECAQLASVPCLERDVFLDNLDDPQYVFRQIKELVRVVKRKKRAIGIGHLKATTLEGLRLAIPYLAEERIEVVPLSELLRE